MISRTRALRRPTSITRPTRPFGRRRRHADGRHPARRRASSSSACTNAPPESPTTRAVSQVGRMVDRRDRSACAAGRGSPPRAGPPRPARPSRRRFSSRRRAFSSSTARIAPTRSKAERTATTGLRTELRAPVPPRRSALLDASAASLMSALPSSRSRTDRPTSRPRAETIDQRSQLDRQTGPMPARPRHHPRLRIGRSLWPRTAASQQLRRNASSAMRALQFNL